MLFSNLLTYGRRKNVRRIAAAVLIVFIVLLPIQNVLTAPAVSVAHAQSVDMCTGGGTTSDCLGSIIYLFAVYLPSQFAYATGYLFNAALQIALNSTSYALNFLSQGWTVVRDIANLSFIFILIYIAYIIIMRAETAGTLRMLAWVVAMALLINFSFFITRLAIDAGNILAVQFYNALPISKSIPSPLSAQNCPPNCIKDLTAGIMDAVKIQGILSDSSFKAYREQNSSYGFFSNLGVLSLAFISVGIFLSLLGFMFLIVGIKFIVRVIILWLAIIASPLAFAAHALPSNKKIMGYYQIWQDNLIQSSFYPAVFLFLFFIMTLLMQALAGDQGLIPSIFTAAKNLNNGQNPTAATGIISIIANIAVRMGLVTVLLYFAMKASDSFSSMGSGIANSVVSWTGSKAANLTAGSSAWLARNSAGRLANTAARSQTVRDWAAANPLYGGRLASGALNKVATSTLDVRGIGGLKNLVKKADIDLKSPGGKGGYRKQEAERAKATEAFAKGLKSDSVYVKQNALGVGRQVYEEQHGKGSVEELEKIRARGVEAAIREYEANYDSQPGRTAGDYRKRIGDLEQLREKAEKDATEFEKAGNKAEADRARAVVTANARQLAQLQSESSQKYTGATKDLAGLQKLGENRIKELDKARINKVADYVESRRFGNLYVPSVGDVEGSMKARKVVTEKSKEDQAADLLAEVAKEKLKKEEEEKKTGPQPLSLKAIRTDAQKPGGLKGSTEALANAVFSEDMLKRLDVRMKNVQENTLSQGKRLGNVEDSLDTLDKTLQRQQSAQPPTSPTAFGTGSTGRGTLRPTAGTKVTEGTDDKDRRRISENRGGVGTPFTPNTVVPPTSTPSVQPPSPSTPPKPAPPPSNDQANPPKAA